jgi:hypothetical protein
LPWNPSSPEELAEAVREAEEERAAIMEFDGGLPRAEAERRTGMRAWRVRGTSASGEPYAASFISPDADTEAEVVARHAAILVRVSKCWRC